MNPRLVAQLSELSVLMQHDGSLEDGLRDLALLTAETIGAERCSVMLVEQDDDESKLRICSHFGDMPAQAYAAPMPLDRGIAGQVALSGESLLINNLFDSPLAPLARRGAGKSPSMMSAPIRVGDSVIGVINLSVPTGRTAFAEHDLDVLNVFALFVGKSIQVYQLQKLAESRLLQMAQLVEQRGKGGGTQGPICPDPGMLAKLVAKNFYRELAAAGFGTNAIISVSSQVLSELNEQLARHHARRERQHRGTE
jgi:L-methionine (R)-S-oxide reductase